MENSNTFNLERYNQILDEYCKKEHISQAELIKRLEIGRTNFYRIKNGELRPSTRILENIVKLTNISYDDFFKAKFNNEIELKRYEIMEKINSELEKLSLEQLEMTYRIIKSVEDQR